jgi:hypothetical protein
MFIFFSLFFLNSIRHGNAECSDGSPSECQVLVDLALIAAVPLNLVVTIEETD